MFSWNEVLGARVFKSHCRLFFLFCPYKVRPKVLFLSTMVKRALPIRCVHFVITKQMLDGYFKNMEIFLFLEMDCLPNGGSGSFGA